MIRSSIDSISIFKNVNGRCLIGKLHQKVNGMGNLLYRLDARLIKRKSLQSYYVAYVIDSVSMRWLYPVVEQVFAMIVS